MYDKFQNYKKRDCNKRFRILILGALSTVNWTQYTIIEKYLLPKLTLNDCISMEIRLIGSNLHSRFKRLYEHPVVTHHEYINDITEEFLSCDIFLSPTPEILGMRVRILEAMSYQNCLLVSKCDKEALPILVDNHNCRVIAKHDKIYQEIKFLQSNAFLRQELSKNARLDFIKYSDIDKSCKVYEDDMLKIINS